MTLITYLTRIHFADGVLEEAIWSELEASKKKRPLIVHDEGITNSPTFDRLISGLPATVKPVVHSDLPPVPTEKSARFLANLYHENGCDVLIAMGAKRTVELVKAVRVAIVHNVDLDIFSYAAGGSRRIGTELPDYIAVPLVSGVPASVSAHTPIILNSGERALFMCKKLIPTVTICDPTLTETTPAVASASAGVEAITLCVEAFLSKSYNPPAEGIAIDGLNRAVSNLDVTLQEPNNLCARREMMAAGLNGSLALQKGLGASNAISNAIEIVAENLIDHGALNRIALPAVLNFNRDACDDKYEALHRVLRFSNDHDFVDGISRYFEGLPLPGRLGELGLNQDTMVDAAKVAAKDLATGTNPRDICESDYLDIMKSVY